MYDTLVIGCGQAGLAMGYYLRQAGGRFMILGSEARIGDVWRSRYDSLVLFTPRWFSSLPGLAMSGDPHGYATKDEAADYLEEYAARQQLPVQLNTEVRSLTAQTYKTTLTGQLGQSGQSGQTLFTVSTSRGVYAARNVVIATGPFRQPVIPSFASGLADSVRQLHAAQYRNERMLRDGPVAVVGGGNSGAQIAEELSAGGRTVYWSANGRLNFMPLELLGRSIFWWFDKLGVYKAGSDTAIGRRLRSRGDPILGTGAKRRIASGRIQLKPGAVDAAGHSLLFADGSWTNIGNVVWATGYTPDYSWLYIPEALDVQGKPLHIRGASPVRGLYFLGLPWLHTRGSALIGGVSRDAEHIMSCLAR